MSSGNLCVIEDSQLRNMLERFHLLLYNLYQDVKRENEHQKSVIGNLSKFHSHLAGLKKLNTDASLVCSPDNVVNEASFPELKESEELLRKCRMMKKKFQSPPSSCNHSNKGQVELVGPVTTSNPVPFRAQERKLSKVESSRDEIPKTSLYSVISEKQLEQLNEMITQGKGKSPVSKETINKEPRSQRKSYQQVVEMNKELKAKLSLKLQEGRSKSALLFQQEMESSLCHDCSKCIEIDKSLESRIPKKHTFNFEDPKSEIIFSDFKDVTKLCNLLSEAQFFEFHSMVACFVEENVLPLLKHQNSIEKVPISLLKNLLNLCLPEDHTNDNL